MNTSAYWLLLVSAGVGLNTAANYFNSRKIYLQEQQMAVGKAEVLAAIAEERRQVLEAIRKAQESAKPEDLSDLLAAVQGIYEENPVEEPEVTEESPAEITEDFVDIGVTAEPEAVTDGE